MWNGSFTENHLTMETNMNCVDFRLTIKLFVNEIFFFKELFTSLKSPV